MTYYCKKKKKERKEKKIRNLTTEKKQVQPQNKAGIISSAEVISPSGKV